MGQLERFEIFLDKYVCYPGDMLSGKVVVWVTEPMKMRKILISAHGFASVTIRIGRTGYHDKEEYFKYKSVVWESGESKTLASGHYEFSFTFQLPADLPASVVSDIGRIIYECKAKIDRHGSGSPSLVAEEYFAVMKRLDLNNVERAKNAAEAEDERTLTCCFRFKPESFEVKARLPKIGFAIGENIRLAAEITNHGSRSIVCTKLKFIQIVKCCTSYNPYLTEDQERTILKLDDGPIPSGTIITRREPQIEVPVLPPSNLENSGLISVSYRLDYFVISAGVTSPIILQFPIIIGTEPVVT